MYFFYQNYSKECNFSYFVKLYEYCGNFQSSYKAKKFSMEKIMRLILDEVIMSDRYMSYGQMFSFLQLFFNTEKARLNWRLDSTVTEYVLLIIILKPL